MTGKEREKLKLNNYLNPPVSEKDAAKLLAKELRKSLGKKGYQVEKSLHELYHDEEHGDFKYAVKFGLKGYVDESFEIPPTLVKTWAENDLSVLKTAKEGKEFKKFTKAVKKHLKEAGRFTEPKEEMEDER